MGRGPSLNTWPRWAPQLEHTTSVRGMNSLKSVWVSTAEGSTGSKNEGHPVPESYLVSDENSGSPHTMHR